LGAAASQDVALFDIRPAINYLNDQQSGQQTGGQKAFVGENPARGTTISYYLTATDNSGYTTYDPATAPKMVKVESIELAAQDYYDTYWKDYWPRLHEKHAKLSGPKDPISSAGSPAPLPARPGE
jgi:hypothetical protein